MLAWLWTKEGCEFISRTFDVPKQVRVCGKVYPIGQTLISRLRAEVGLPDTDPRRVEVAQDREFAYLVDTESAVAREVKRERGARRAGELAGGRYHIL